MLANRPRAKQLAGWIVVALGVACAADIGPETASEGRVADVAVSLGASSILVGDGTQATAVLSDENGNTLTDRPLTWTSSNSSVASVDPNSGAVTGISPGNSAIAATSGGVTGTATITVRSGQIPAPVAAQLSLTTQPPPSMQSGAILSPSPVVQLRSASNAPVSQSGVVVTAAIASGGATLGGTLTAATNANGAATFSALTLNGSGAVTIRFTATGLTGVTSTSVMVSTSGSGGGSPTVLLEERFEDSNLSSRGWFDSPGTTFSTTDHIDGSTQSLRLQYSQGAQLPQSNVRARHSFTPSERVYLRYWVKYSSNWVGSGKPYQPHEFQFLTTEDDKWIGPGATHLTTYVETNWQSAGGFAMLAEQDALNIDVARINQDLTNVTENRAVSGCNGNPGGEQADCYPVTSGYQNLRGWKSGAIFENGAGAGYKGDWHKVEVYFQMNSISGNKGQMDGVAQYWFDGQLVIDRHNVIFRTASHPNMKFNTFLIAPYIGDGSPVGQTMWVDDLLIATGR